MIRADDVGRDRDNEAGFTLLEVMIAITILTVGLLAVAGMQTAAIRGNDNAYRVTESTTWAQDRLELLVSLPFNFSSSKDQLHEMRLKEWTRQRQAE